MGQARRGGGCSARRAGALLTPPRRTAPPQLEAALEYYRDGSEAAPAAAAAPAPESPPLCGSPSYGGGRARRDLSGRLGSDSESARGSFDSQVEARNNGAGGAAAPAADQPPRSSCESDRGAAAWPPSAPRLSLEIPPPPQRQPLQQPGECGLSASPAPPATPAWPVSEVAWTRTSRVYEYRTITFRFTDPHLPAALAGLVRRSERLLRLAESGLPGWALLLPTHGLAYRPWMRTITWVAFYALSSFSLAIGFYDLYRNLPGLQRLLRGVMASAWLPPTAVLEWLESHTQFRLSILLTYLVGKSEVVAVALRWAEKTARPALRVRGLAGWAGG